MSRNFFHITALAERGLRRWQFSLVEEFCHTILSHPDMGG